MVSLKQNVKQKIPGVFMKKEHDFSGSKKNPYIKELKKPVTIRLSSDILVYFKELAKEIGIPYQQLINFYLRDCVEKKKKIKIKWAV
jgi:predicted DNA binding CopG/RHH family protein